MTKNAVLKILNPILGVFILNQALTGIFADEIFARSPRAFTILHVGGGYCLVAQVLLHLVLNWNWIKASYFRKAALPKA
jgi:hypothetical protein